jgi:multimeric flavodoxin WrbA
MIHMQINKVAFIGKGGVGLLYGSMIAQALGNDAVEYVMDDARFERHAGDALNGGLADHAGVHGCAAGNGCVFGGVVNEAIEKAKTADGFVFGSPVHYASASGNMTSFMDRLAYAGGRYLAYKPAAICCSARRAGTTTTLDQLVKYPQFFHMPLVNGSYWAMVHGSNAEQVLQDAEGCAVMQELGRNMAWLLHCIEAGRAAGFEHPQNPKRPMTNFIR